MTIPIDKLYHYIDSIVKDVCNNDTLIYRFYPHGSKKLENLKVLNPTDYTTHRLAVELYAHDQEPLDYDYYRDEFFKSNFAGRKLFEENNVTISDRNLRRSASIYDRCILLHSELRSDEVAKYSADQFIPAYYWSHAIIALDWFRYALYEKPVKNIKKLFLIYNRAWSGTREYRLKFIDLLIDYNLLEECHTTINVIDPELTQHYTTHIYKKAAWRPINNLDGRLATNKTTSCASADYELSDYQETAFEVVLETLFDDTRLHLTEKILRPIALGQPFLLAATHGSLNYLRSYGFRTFEGIIDESYDTIEDPKQRLEAVVTVMKQITQWSGKELKEKLVLANQIAIYNRKHFFSTNFCNQVVNELENNLLIATHEVETTNTSKAFLDRRKELIKYSAFRPFLLEIAPRKKIAQVVLKARQYYQRTQ